jgi:hypothetical protein
MPGLDDGSGPGPRAVHENRLSAAQATADGLAMRPLIGLVEKRTTLGSTLGPLDWPRTSLDALGPNLDHHTPEAKVLEESPCAPIACSKV